MIIGLWWIVGEAIAQRKNIHLETIRYSYRPFWALILGFFSKLSLFFLNFDKPFRERYLLSKDYLNNFSRIFNFSFNKFIDFFSILCLFLVDFIIYDFLTKRDYDF